MDGLVSINDNATATPAALQSSLPAVLPPRVPSPPPSNDGSTIQPATSPSPAVPAASPSTAVPTPSPSPVVATITPSPAAVPTPSPAPLVPSPALPTPTTRSTVWSPLPAVLAPSPSARYGGASSAVLSQCSFASSGVFPEIHELSCLTAGIVNLVDLNSKISWCAVRHPSLPPPTAQHLPPFRAQRPSPSSPPARHLLLSKIPSLW